MGDVLCCSWLCCAVEELCCAVLCCAMTTPHGPSRVSTCHHAPNRAVTRLGLRDCLHVVVVLCGALFQAIFWKENSSLCFLSVSMLWSRLVPSDFLEGKFWLSFLIVLCCQTQT